jgi:glycosyltransferase involved in cell wall biosynthesis
LKSELKKRISIWIHGGIGGGNFSQGQPVVGNVIESLSPDFDVNVYSQLPPNPDFVPLGYSLYSPSRYLKIGSLRWLYLSILFLFHHFRKPFDILYAFWGYPAGCIAVALGKITNRRCIIHLQGGDSVSIPKLQYGAFHRPISRQICSWAYHECSTLIALTNYQKETLLRQGIDRKIEIVPYGPDLRLFKAKPNRKKWNEWRFIHVGNHNLLKDQGTLLRTFKILSHHLPSCKLKIIGYDALDGELVRLAAQLGITDSVEFTGPVPYHDIPYHFHQADVLLHTSVFEGQATVISEAAAVGLLLAGTRVGLLADLGDDCGLIVDKGDAEGLAKKILKTLNDPESLCKHIKNARQWTEHHDHLWTMMTIKSLINNPV